MQSKNLFYHNKQLFSTTLHFRQVKGEVKTTDEEEIRFLITSSTKKKNNFTLPNNEK